MSYVAYYIGGPVDLRKEVLQGHRFLPNVLRVADIPPLAYVDVAGLPPRSEALTVTYHTYDLVSEPHDRQGTYAVGIYVWRRDQR